MVWQGAPECRLSDTMLRDEGTAPDKAVAAVFEGFPVRASAPAALASGLHHMAPEQTVANARSWPTCALGAVADLRGGESEGKRLLCVA